jgi:hypothetical protein
MGLHEKKVTNDCPLAESGGSRSLHESRSRGKHAGGTRTEAKRRDPGLLTRRRHLYITLTGSTKAYNLPGTPYSQ